MDYEHNVEMKPVWDPLVRVGHWLLVIAFFVAYFTEDDPLTVHVWAGYTVGFIVITRILWGFIGPRHTRFTDFLYSSGKIFGYLRDLLRGSAKRYLGHSPAGGGMVLLLLASLAGTTWTGIMVYAYEEQAGPMAGFVISDTTHRDAADSAIDREEDESDNNQLAQEAETHDADFDAREDFWEELHEFLANFTLLLIFFHISGVLLASFVHRENLIMSMVHGRKRID